MGDAADDNEVLGSFIGTDAAGRYGDGSAFTLGAGLWLYTGPSGNRVGSPDPADRNVISGNRTVGVKIEQHGSAGNVVANNLIGVNPSVTAALPNNSGFDLQWRSSDNRIGGVTDAKSATSSPATPTPASTSRTPPFATASVGNHIGTNADGSGGAVHRQRGRGPHQGQPHGQPHRREPRQRQRPERDLVQAQLHEPQRHP